MVDRTCIWFWFRSATDSLARRAPVGTFPDVRASLCACFGADTHVHVGMTKEIPNTGQIAAEILQATQLFPFDTPRLQTRLFFSRPSVDLSDVLTCSTLAYIFPRVLATLSTPLGEGILFAVKHRSLRGIQNTTAVGDIFLFHDKNMVTLRGAGCDARRQNQHPNISTSIWYHFVFIDFNALLYGDAHTLGTCSVKALDGQMIAKSGRGYNTPGGISRQMLNLGGNSRRVELFLSIPPGPSQSLSGPFGQLVLRAYFSKGSED